MTGVSTSPLGRDPARPGRGRRPAAEVRHDVLSAAADLLFDEGVRAVTFDRVAATAAASRTTLYKWWPSPGALAADAYLQRVAPTLLFPDTGDVVADVRAQMLAFAHLMQHERAGVVIRELIGLAQTDPDLREQLATRYSRPRRTAATLVLERAQAAGRIRSTAALDVLVDQLWGACYHRLLVLDEPVDAALVDRMIDSALRPALSSPRGG